MNDLDVGNLHSDFEQRTLHSLLYCCSCLHNGHDTQSKEHVYQQSRKRFQRPIVHTYIRRRLSSLGRRYQFYCKPRGWHPDKHQQATEDEQLRAKNQYIKIQEAHAVLSDESRRQDYD
eukprot:Filipodium_phascolosomae@DN315_c0_g1_i3.p2